MAKVKFLGAIIGLLALSLMVDGSGCRVVTVRQNNAAYAQPVYAAQAVQHVYAASYVPYASYSIGYSAGSELVDVVRELIKDNREMREEMRALYLRGPEALRKESFRERHPGALVMAAKCANCHDEVVAKAKGGGHALFRGGEFLDEGDNLDRAAGELDAGRMPKGGKLSDSEKYQVLSYLVLKPPGPEKVEAKKK